VFRAARDRNVRRNYGISLEEYEAKLQAQGDRCAICQEVFVNSPHLDHGHESGELRQFLCGLCNKGLGQFRDSVEHLEAAAAYLRTYRKEV
jgi:hypothetical protein